MLYNVSFLTFFVVAIETHARLPPCLHPPPFYLPPITLPPLFIPLLSLLLPLSALPLPFSPINFTALLLEYYNHAVLKLSSHSSMLHNTCMDSLIYHFH